MARVSFKNMSATEDALKKQLYDKMAQKVPQLSIKSTQLIQQAYSGEFSKDPVDTGTAKSNSRATVTIQGRNSQGQDAPTIKVEFAIQGLAEDYAIYFLEPLQRKNPNFKYGKRNTVKRARDNLANFLGIATKNV